MTNEEKPFKKPRDNGREKISFERASREELVDAQVIDESDGIVEISLRPPRLDDLVGQENLKENLRIALAAALRRRRERGIGGIVRERRIGCRRGRIGRRGRCRRSRRGRRE